MAGIAGSGPVRALSDVVGRGIPVIGKGVVMGQGKPGFVEGIPDGGDDAQRRNLIPVPGVFPEDEARFGFGAGSFMAIVAVSILAAGVTTIATYFALVNVVGHLRQRFLRLDCCVAVFAGRPILNHLLGEILLTVAVEFPLLVAVQAHHPFLVVDIRRSAVFTRVFRINASSVTEGAGLALIPLDEFVSLDQAQADSRNGRRFHMAPATGGVTAPAGLLEDAFIEGLQFRFGKPCHDPLSLAYRCIMEGFFIVGGNLPVAAAAGFEFVRRPFHQALVG